MNRQTDSGKGSATQISHTPPSRRGPLAWMAQNPVAANILMLLLIGGGLLMAGTIKQEVFPDLTPDVVQIVVPYPGAGPEEVEQGIVLAVEEAVRSIDGVKRVESSAQEGAGMAMVEMFARVNHSNVYNDIKSAVDRITTLPQDAERPLISLLSRRQQVITLILHGDVQEQALRNLAETVRDDLLQDSRITFIELGGIRPPEITIEVPEETLRQHNLTLGEIAAAVGRASLDLPGGGIRSRRGEILLRTVERRDYGHQFDDIEVVSLADGTVVTLADLSTVVDGFQEIDREAFFNGERAVQLNVFQVGDEKPLEVAAAAKEYFQDILPAILPEGVGAAVWNDRSEVYESRINLLLKNGFIGLFMVLLILGLFLQPRLAFWVTMGLPMSMLGAMLFMPTIGVTINMITLFGFILTLGIVVDDAIVVGESVYKHQRDGLGGVDAAIAGVREVAGPVVFSILTTIIAFSALLFVPGIMGRFFRGIPIIVIPILLISLFEALFILPAHLAHSNRKAQERNRPQGWVTRQQARFSQALERFIHNRYQPFIRLAVRARFLTMAVGLSLLIIVLGVVMGGRIRFTFMPIVEGDTITAGVVMPFGAPVEETRETLEHMVRTAREVMEEYGGEGKISRGIYSEVGQAPRRGGPLGGTPASGSHLGSVSLFFVDSGQRNFSLNEFTRRWRMEVGEIPGVETLAFRFRMGPQAGAPVNVELSHQSPRTLETAADSLAGRLQEYDGLFEIDSGYTRGKEQINLTLKPEGRSLGITQQEMARQVRNAFFGAPVTRQQRGRDELRIYVRRPLAERRSEHSIDEFLLQVPGGGEVTLRQAAHIDRDFSYTKINRKDGRRIMSVTADLDQGVTSSQDVVRSLENHVLPTLMADFPGLRYGIGGEEEERAESFGALGRSFMLALMCMYVLMAIAFRSYLQPLIVMLAIPFGLVGAVAGHMLMGYTLSLISMMGIVALSGVVVNDSLVLISAINNLRHKEGLSPMEAAVRGGVRRFRPILLTSLTTFFGLAPMIFETSRQARFLVPMALSLGFGIIFVTFITLVIVPVLYLITEELRVRMRGIKRADRGGESVTRAHREEIGA